MPVGHSQPGGVYHIGGSLLKEVNEGKDLGIITTSDLTTSRDTTNKVRAATRLMWSIKRSFLRLNPEMTRILIMGQIRPILEYGQPAIYPLTVKERTELERVQRRATRIPKSLRACSYEERLEHLNLFPLQWRRIRGDLIYTWRILRAGQMEEMRRFFPSPTMSTTRGHPFKIFKSRRHRISPLLTLSTRVVNSWNGLPDQVVRAATEDEFKRMLDELYQSRSGSCSPAVLHWTEGVG